jgi:hypothetical protein
MIPRDRKMEKEGGKNSKFFQKERRKTKWVKREEIFENGGGGRDRGRGHYGWERKGPGPDRTPI